MYEEKLINFFSGIEKPSPDQISLIKFHYKFDIINKNTFFIKAGRIQKEIGFVIKGIFRSFSIDKSGNETTKLFIPEGGFLICLDSFLTEGSSKINIESLEDSMIFHIKCVTLKEMIKTDEYWKKVYMKLLENVYFIMDKREQYHVEKDNLNKYKNFLMDFPGLIDRVKHHQIASFLGMTPESLSRIRKKFKIIDLNQ